MRALRVLLVSFYFPPAGGGGVQRSLRFADHLARSGVDVHVLAPDDPRWLHRDEDLAPPKGVVVHRARYVGPRGMRPAEELYGRTGVDRLVRRAALTPRRLLIPDENVSWLATAAPCAIRIARREKIDVVVTSSPPSSVHLIGPAIKRLTSARWIADLRDSIVAKQDRRFERLAVRVKEHGNVLVARAVARWADAIVGVTDSIGDEMRALGARGRIATIPNGCDFDEFEELDYTVSNRFRITHTGSFFGRRSCRAFLEAFAQTDPAAVVRFVGDFCAEDVEWAETLGLGDRLELHGFAPHHRALAMQRDSEALLLLLPEIGARGKDVPSGKLFEYLAAERPILAAVPPDGTAAALVESARAGRVVAPNDVSAMKNELDEMVRRWRAGSLDRPRLPVEWRERLSRETRTRELFSLLQAVSSLNGN
ncbi:MAG: glycosyltransferase family 4 protein [Gaiellaceae bacterium]